MKMKFKLFSIFACLVMIFGMMGCSNLIEDLKDKTQPDVPQPDPVIDVVEVTSITLDATANITVNEGETITLTATVHPANATDKTVTWTSSDETVATVENGIVKGKKGGTVTITATAGGKSVSVTVTVKETVKYNIDWSTKTVTDGKTLYELAAKSKKIVFGKPTDYASVIADTATYTKYAVGETDDDLIYAYYKPNDDSFVDFDFSTCKAEVYILSEGKIKFTDNDLISEEIQNKVIGSFGIPVGIFAFCFYAKEINLQNINTTELTDMILMFGFDMNVKELNLSEIDTSNVTNMLGMFTNCSEIKTLDISSFNTSKVTNMSAMFGGSDATEPCEKLESINFGNIDTRNVTSMSDMFKGCKALKSIDLSKFDTSNVTDMEAMFLSCKSLTSIDVSTFDTAKVTNMRYMFYGCVIPELDISTFDFTSIVKTYNMFGNCQNLKTIYAKEGTDLSGMASITDSAEMFKNCTVLVGGNGTKFSEAGVTDYTYARIDAAGTKGYFTKKGDAPYVPPVTYNIDWNTTAIADLSKTPYGLATEACKIIFGKTADYSTVTADTATYTKYAIGETDNDAVYAYYKAASDDSSYDSELYVLSEGEIVFDEDDMIDAGGGKLAGPFIACTQAKNIVLKNVNTKAFTTLFGAFAQCLKLESIDISGLDTENVTSIEYMFTWCPSLKSVDLSMLNTSKLENMSNLFRCEGDAGLETVIFGNMDTSKVTSMDGLFYNCVALKNVDLSKFNTSKVTNFYRMFYSCESLENLDLSNFDTSSATSMNDMFMSCKKLKTLNLSSFNTEKVNTMEFMFDNCKSLQTLDLSSFNTSNVQNMYMMFNSCESLKTLNLTSFNTSEVKNMSDMFKGCSQLTELDLCSFTFESIDETNFMFSDSTNLKTIYVKAGTDFNSTSISYGSYMFEGCTSLVGGNGTPFDPSSYTDYTYARVDKAGTPGYFTARQVTISKDKDDYEFGDSVTLTANYTGRAGDSVTYQWCHYDSDTKVSTPIEGETSETYNYTIGAGYKTIFRVIVTVTGSWSGTVESDIIYVVPGA